MNTNELAINSNMAMHVADQKKLMGKPMKISYRGYEGEIIKSESLGHLSGYVALPSGHPDYGKGVDELYHYDVHGGITYVDGFFRGDRTWVIGFDCAHAGDFIPEIGLWHDGVTYKDIAYVQENIESLINQLEEENKWVN